MESLGCAKNQVDSEVMIAALTGGGWEYVRDPDRAGVIIVNTCGFIREAKEESIETAIALRINYPDAIIVMAGCLTQRYRESLQKELPEIDAFCGNRNPEAISGLLAGIVRADVRAPGESAVPARPGRTIFLSYPGSAYVKIADGCDNCCSYCSIPIIRGGLESRNVGEVTDEVKQLIRRGIIEVNVIAQDVGSFGGDRGHRELPALLRSLASIRDEFRLRLLYIHPDNFPMDILDIIRDDPRFLPYFDIPFQHASGRILTAMGRRGTGGGYLRLLDRIRKALPDAVVRSTFLLGFPGENEEDFASLLEFQARAEINWLGCFTYSREEGTKAAGMRPRVKKSVALKRKKEIESRQIPITERWLDRSIGRRVEVLIEEPVAGEDLAIGRSYMQAPEVDGLVVVRGGNRIPGRMERVRLIRRNGVDLEGIPDETG
ncbi:MAG: 30S ribosomal protein S12 methylthiotransferase RimO [Spirochaetales bacterium]|nr:30S ribosomal protein S12 methylthiotransferase RimO [Spirochaetales bacterium]